LANSRSLNERRGQRKPKNIKVETYANIAAGGDEKRILPDFNSSREQTSMDEASSLPDTPGEVKFFSGNPFVEQTAGILHLYKKK
jgi:hypothetical protein